MKSTRRDLPATGVQVPELDDLHAERQRAWREARDRALVAYRRWSAAAHEHGRDLYAAYRAAEDQEAAAADHLRVLAYHAA
jgi:hypothetical protein